MGSKTEIIQEILGGCQMEECNSEGRKYVKIVKLSHPELINLKGFFVVTKGKSSSKGVSEEIKLWVLKGVAEFSILLFTWPKFSTISLTK